MKLKNLKRMAITGLLIFMFATVAFAMYKTSIQVTYNGTAGNMICEATIDQNDEYVVNGVPYFLVTVKNYNDEGLTNADIDYSLTIKNKTGSNGLFIWKKDDDYISTYAKQVVTNIYSLGKDKKEEHTFQVFVKTADESTEDVDVEVKLDAVQKKME